MVKWLGIAEETTFRTPVTPVEFVKFIRDSINPDWAKVKLEESARRFAEAKIPGPYKEAGDIELYIDAQSITKFLKWLTGSVTTTSDGLATPVAYRHEFTPANSIKSFTLEINPEVGTYSRQLAGCAITSLAIEAVAREPVTGTISVLVAEPKLITPSTFGSFVNKDVLWFQQGKVSLAGSPISGRVEAFRCTYENAIADDAFVIGDMFLPAIRLEGASLVGEMDLAFTDWSYYQRFFGKAGATTPQTAPEEVAIRLELTGRSTGSTAAGFENYKITIDLPKSSLDTTNANVDRRARIVQRLGFEALYDDASGYAVKYTVINTKSSP